MLYITTRNQFDAYTVARVLQPGRAADGGLYQPYHLPVFDAETLGALMEKPFSECVSQMINLFFSCRMTAWDVEFTIGRHPVRTDVIGSKILIVEMWHNLEESFSRLEKNMAREIAGERFDGNVAPWVSVAVRIAVLFGLFAELSKTGAVSEEKPVDIAVPSGDFLLPMAVWFARKMGLPIANIVCGCNENSGVWDMIHLGQLNTGAAVVCTELADANHAVPAYLEQLVFNTLGFDACRRFCDINEKGGLYKLAKEELDILRDGLYAGVVSQERVKSIISNVERTVGYVVGPYDALAYGALMDYRAKTGETRPALVLSEKCASCDEKLVCDALGIFRQELATKLK